MTLCPRLETGKSSETPCSSPRTIACGYVISVGEDHVAAAVRFGPVLNQAKTKQASPTRNAAMPCFT